MDKPVRNDREGRILLNGHLIDKIQLEKGVSQGDIISLFILIIAVEILLIKITKSKNIKGVTMGLNCTELNTSFMALQINWFIRYIDYRYDDFWTLTLDKLFKVNSQNRISIPNYGSECFSPLIENCKYDIIKSMLHNLQNFLQEFVTRPESGDNCFIFQSVFHNTNIRVKDQKSEYCLTPEYYG